MDNKFEAQVSSFESEDKEQARGSISRSISPRRWSEGAATTLFEQEAKEARKREKEAMSSPVARARSQDGEGDMPSNWGSEVAVSASAGNEMRIRVHFEAVVAATAGAAGSGAGGESELQIDQLAELMRRLEIPFGDSQLKHASREMDADGSGSVDYDEFLAWWRAMGLDNKQNIQLWQAFCAIDDDGSGSIDAEELGTLVTKMKLELTAEQLDEAMKEMDEDDSGEVSYLEFSEWFAKAAASGSELAAGMSLGLGLGLGDIAQGALFEDEEDEEEEEVDDLEDAINAAQDMFNDLLAQSFGGSQEMLGLSLGIFAPDHPFRVGVSKIIFNPAFEIFIMACIIVNVAALLQQEPGAEQHKLVSAVNFVCGLIFTVEMVLRVIVFGFLTHEGSYLRSPWNAFDFAIVMCYWTTYILAQFLDIDTSLSACFTLLRSFRMLRFFGGIREVLSALGQGSSMIVTVSSVMLFLFVAFATSSQQLFGGVLNHRCQAEELDAASVAAACPFCSNLSATQKCPTVLECEPRGMTCYNYMPPLTKVYTNASFYMQHRRTVHIDKYGFDTIAESLLTVWTLSTGDEWGYLCNMYREAESSTSWAAWPVFSGLVVLLSLFATNLFVASVTIAYMSVRTRAREDDTMAGLRDMVMSNLEKEKLKLADGTDLDDGEGSPTADYSDEEDLEADEDLTTEELRTDHCMGTCCKFSPYLTIKSQAIIQTRWFDSFIMITVLANIVVMAAEHHGQADGFVVFLAVVEYLFTTIYTFEVAVKLQGLGCKRYFQVPMNRLDFGIVFVALLGYVLEFMGSNMDATSAQALRIIRVLARLARLMRVARVGKLLARVKSIRTVLKVAFGSWGAIASLSSLFIFVVFVSAMMANFIFWTCHVDDRPGRRQTELSGMNLATRNQAYMSVFQLATGDDWSGLMFEYMECFGTSASLYFVVVVFATRYLLLNLYISVFLENFQLNDEEKRIRQMEQYTVQMLKESDGTKEGNAAATLAVANALSRDGSLGRLKLGSLVTAVSDGVQKAAKPAVRLLDTAVSSIDPMQQKSEQISDDGSVDGDRSVADDGNMALCCLPIDSPFRQMCVRIVESDIFEYAIISCILASGMHLALEGPGTYADSDYWPRWFVDTMGVLDIVLFFAFLVEFVMKCLAYGFISHPESYLKRSSANVLDFTVVVATSVDTILDMIGASAGVAKLFRLLRVFRLVRLLLIIDGMQVILFALAAAFPSVSAILALQFTSFIVFGILGMNLFMGKFYRCTNNIHLDRVECETLYGADAWQNSEYNFDNIFESSASLFVCMSIEGWIKLLRMGMDSTTMSIPVDKECADEACNLAPKQDDSALGAFLFFAGFMIINAFMLDKLFVGVLVDFFQQESGSALMTAEQKNWRFMEVMSLHLIDDDRRPPQGNKVREECFRLAKSTVFQRCVNAFILLDIISIVLGNTGLFPLWFEDVLLFVNEVTLAVYTYEALVRAAAYGVKEYLRSDRLPFSIVAIMWVIIVHQNLKKNDWFDPNGYFDWIQGLDFVQILRMVRLMSTSISVRKLLQLIRISLPQVVNLVTVMTLQFFIFGILAMKLYGDIPQQDGSSINQLAHFHDIRGAIMLLFQIATGQPIIELTTDIRQELGGHPFVFFATFYVLSNMILLSLFTALLLDNLDLMGASDFAITDADVQTFHSQWNKLGLAAAETIHVSQLRGFVLSVGGTFTVVTAADPNWFNRLLLDLDVPPEKLATLDSETFTFHQVLLSLCHLRFNSQCLPYEMQIIANSRQESARKAHAARVIVLCFRAYHMRNNPPDLSEMRAKAIRNEFGLQKLSALKRRAQDAGIDADIIAATDDEPDTKRAVIQLLLESYVQGDVGDGHLTEELMVHRWKCAVSTARLWVLESMNKVYKLTDMGTIEQSTKNLHQAFEMMQGWSGPTVDADEDEDVKLAELGDDHLEKLARGDAEAHEMLLARMEELHVQRIKVKGGITTWCVGGRFVGKAFDYMQTLVLFFAIPVLVVILFHIDINILSEHHALTHNILSPAFAILVVLPTMSYLGCCYIIANYFLNPATFSARRQMLMFSSWAGTANYGAILFGLTERGMQNCRLLAIVNQSAYFSQMAWQVAATYTAFRFVQQGKLRVKGVRRLFLQLLCWIGPLGLTCLLYLLKQDAFHEDLSEINGMGWCGVRGDVEFLYWKGLFVHMPQLIGVSIYAYCFVYIMDVVDPPETTVLRRSADECTVTTSHHEDLLHASTGKQVLAMERASERIKLYLTGFMLSYLTNTLLTIAFERIKTDSEWTTFDYLACAVVVVPQQFMYARVFNTTKGDGIMYGMATFHKATILSATGRVLDTINSASAAFKWMKLLQAEQTGETLTVRLKKSVVDTSSAFQQTLRKQTKQVKETSAQGAASLVPSSALSKMNAAKSYCVHRLFQCWQFCVLMPVSVWVWTPIDFIRESYTKRLDTVLVSLMGYGIFLLAPIFYFRVTDSASPLESEGLSPEELNMTYDDLVASYNSTVPDFFEVKAFAVAATGYMIIIATLCIVGAYQNRYNFELLVIHGPARFLRKNRRNVLGVYTLAIEWSQIAMLAFTAGRLMKRYKSPGSSDSEQTWTKILIGFILDNLFYAQYYGCVIAVGVWASCFAAPSIVQKLYSRKAGEAVISQLDVVFFVLSGPGFLMIVKTLMKPLFCYDDPLATAAPVTVADSDLQCWTRDHLDLVWPSLICLCIFFPSATLTTAIKYQADEDIRYVFLYLRLEFIVKGFMLFLSLRFANHEAAAMLFLMAGSCAIIILVYFMRPCCLQGANLWKMVIHATNLWTCATCLWAVAVDNRNWKAHAALAFPGWLLIGGAMLAVYTHNKKSDALRLAVDDPATKDVCCAEIKELQHSIGNASSALRIWGVHYRIMRLLLFAEHENIVVRRCAFEALATLSYWTHVTGKEIFVPMTPNTSMVLVLDAVLDEDEATAIFAVRILTAFVARQTHIRELVDYLDNSPLDIPLEIALLATRATNQSSKVQCMKCLLALSYIDSNTLDAVASCCVPMLAEWATSGSVVSQHVAAELFMNISGRFDLTAKLVGEGALPKIVALFMAVDDIEAKPEELQENLTNGFRPGAKQPQQVLVAAHQLPDMVAADFRSMYDRVVNIEEAQSSTEQNVAELDTSLDTWAAWMQSGTTLGGQIKGLIVEGAFGEKVAPVKAKGVTQQHLHQLFMLMDPSAQTASSDTISTLLSTTGLGQASDIAQRLSSDTISTFLSTAGLGQASDIAQTLYETGLFSYGMTRVSSDDERRESVEQTVLVRWLLIGCSDRASLQHEIMQACIPQFETMSEEELESGLMKMCGEIDDGSPADRLSKAAVANYIVDKAGSIIGRLGSVDALAPEIHRALSHFTGKTEVDCHVQLCAKQVQTIKTEIIKCAMQTLTEIAIAQGARGRQEMIDGGVLVIIKRSFALIKPAAIHVMALNMLHALMNGQFSEVDIEHDGDMAGRRICRRVRPSLPMD
jgi:Ca2+-binding EF-hand superfamily protein